MPPPLSCSHCVSPTGRVRSSADSSLVIHSIISGFIQRESQSNKTSINAVIAQAMLCSALSRLELSLAVAKWQRDRLELRRGRQTNSTMSSRLGCIVTISKTDNHTRRHILPMPRDFCPATGAFSTSLGTNTHTPRKVFLCEARWDRPGKKDITGLYRISTPSLSTSNLRTLSCISLVSSFVSVRSRLR